MARRSFKPTFDPFHGTEKDRAEWFFRRTSFPLRDAAPLELERFWENQEQFAHVHGVKWEEAGPFNFAGRVTSLAVDPNHPNNVYAGAAAGGVWVSQNQGKHWRCIWPKYLSQNIGALAIYPGDSHLLVCATGEANLSPDSCAGNGVYQTKDAGRTWTPSFVGTDGLALPVGDRATVPRRIGTIAYSWDKSIALGAVSHDESMPAALYLDDKEKGLIPNTFWGARSYNCYAVVFHPHKAGRLYAAVAPGGSMNGIWRSDDHGKHWTHLVEGLPRGEVCGRISLAISGQHPEILYALIATRRKKVLGVFRTGNGGKSWSEVGGSHFAGEGQMGYNNTICIHPDNPDFVVCGGKVLHRTTDGGGRWKEITSGGPDDASLPLPDNYVHLDHHAVVIPGGKAGDLIYSANDGGVAVSTDGGDTWDERTTGMNTVMFYAIDVAPSNSKVFGGGAQDNGTLVAGVDKAIGATEFSRVLPGDGGWLVFDPADAEHAFGSTADLNIYRHRRGQPWADGRQLARWGRNALAGPDIEEAEKKARSITVMEIGPGRRGGSKTVWIGTIRLWCSVSDGQSWRPASPVFDGSVISAIEISARRPKLMFVGTTDGGIFRSHDGGKRWSENLAGIDIPKRLITRIETHPQDANTVVATLGIGTPGVELRDDSEEVRKPYSHVFRSVDGGETWKDIDRGQLPNVVYNGMAFETHPPYRLFVCGDAGVWMYDSKDRWASVAGNMPNVMVSDLIFHHRDRILTAATFGRGIWRLDATKKFRVTKREPQSDPQDAGEAPLAAGLLKDHTIPAPRLLSPPDGAVFSPLPPSADLAWAPVPHAVAYIVDLNFGQWVMPLSSVEPKLRFNPFPGGPARWRVWAILPEGRRSHASESRAVTYGEPSSTPPEQGTIEPQIVS